MSGSVYENESSSSSSNSTFAPEHTASENRDEIKELHRYSRKEDNMVRTWRSLVTVGLVVNVAVTWTTYKMLMMEQQNSFENSFGQFARSVRSAARGQIELIQKGVGTLAHAITASAIETNATWPLFTMHSWPSVAEDVYSISGIEILACGPVLANHQREDWTNYANTNYEQMVMDDHNFYYGSLENLNPVAYKPFISRIGEEGFVPLDDNDVADAFAVWQSFPPPRNYGMINWNVASIPGNGPILQEMVALKNDTLITRIRPFATHISFTEEQHAALHSKLINSQVEYPHSFFYHPIHEKLRDYDSKVVAFIAAGIGWDFSLRFLLPDGVSGIVAVLKNDCNQTHSYYLTGADAVYIGPGDKHDTEFDGMKVTANLSMYNNPESLTRPGHCQFYMNVYPTPAFRSQYVTRLPLIFATVTSSLLGLFTIFFLLYDLVVRNRNDKLIENAARSNAVVTDMFPGAMRDKIMAQDGTSKVKHVGQAVPNKDGGYFSEYYLQTTIMFADIAGFTAWSSVRQPSQVFELLEKVFNEFDALAKKRRVFKVETVGDCYVAVAGVPTPRDDHALAIAQFAGRCRTSFNRVVEELELSLGPETADLALRIGIHSGPITGGVIRGERSRFQLFGDTMNTASRMESTGVPDKIQTSQETAQLLIKAGKMGWLTSREDAVQVKGKGKMLTYWVEPQRSKGSSTVSGSTGSDDFSNELPEMDARLQRLIDWTVECLQHLLCKIVVGRVGCTPPREKANGDQKVVEGETFLDEVKESIDLLSAVSKWEHETHDPGTVELDQEVVYQLKDFVTCAATMHRKNPFHNFEHAAHVTLSILKLCSRIGMLSTGDNEKQENRNKDISIERPTPQEQHSLYEKTCRIISEPWVQFACAFSALIHDLDHPGLPNDEIAIEKPLLASKYGNRSVNEQNSLQLALDLFMDERFDALRNLVCRTKDELDLFRQLVVNCVMATDIADRERMTIQNERWNEVFRPQVNGETSSEAVGMNDREDANRMANIVIELLIQASDVAHTMQHWQVYRKWNERLFEEQMDAYTGGRSETNPTKSWGQGEIGFFDNYVIPLAKKLKECAVFGTCSDEYLSYAEQNRAEWIEKAIGVAA